MRTSIEMEMNLGGQITTKIKCNSHFLDTLTDLQEFKREIERQIAERYKCPMNPEKLHENDLRHS